MAESRSRTLLGAAFSAILFAAIMGVLLREPFPANEFSHSELLEVGAASQLGGGFSGFLWEYRGLDLAFQVLVLFAAAFSCLALLRGGEAHG